VECSVGIQDGEEKVEAFICSEVSATPSDSAHSAAIDSLLNYRSRGACIVI
jgi:hypothetical protein